MYSILSRPSVASFKHNVPPEKEKKTRGNGLLYFIRTRGWKLFGVVPGREFLKHDPAWEPTGKYYLGTPFSKTVDKTDTHNGRLVRVYDITLCV